MSEQRHRHLLNYAPWIARDYLTNQGPSTAIVVLLIAFLSLQGAMAAGMVLSEMPPDLARRMLRSLLGTFVFLGTFFATNGIIANDRKLGYYKFLFSKPVAPTVYYAMTFVVYGLGLMLVTAALLVVWSVFVRPAFPAEVFAVVALMYIAFGGIGFLLSAAWRYDWISLVTVLFVANVGWTVWGKSTGLVYLLLHLLPPVHKADSVYAIVMSERFRDLPWDSVAWLGGYGLVCFALGILVIRKRPMGTA
jgi:hypothetical protein